MALKRLGKLKCQHFLLIFLLFLTIFYFSIFKDTNIIMISQLCVLAIALSCAHAGKPKLSDNLGLNNDELTYNFKIKDYVFGSLFPKPQEENKDSGKLMSLDPTKFR